MPKGKFIEGLGGLEGLHELGGGESSRELGGWVGWSNVHHQGTKSIGGKAAGQENSSG